MEPMLRHLFIGMIAEQCGYALRAAANVDAALTRLHATADHAARQEAQDQLWYSLQALLMAAANVSKILWPDERSKIRKFFPERGEELRERLEVPDDSPIASRQIRNDFEHLDERLEEWWRDDPHHNIARRMIGPIGSVISGLPDQSLFEQFDPDQGIVAFRGHVFELRPLVQALGELKERAEQATARPWWEQDDEQESA